jgi:hypothetical protein
MDKAAGFCDTHPNGEARVLAVRLIGALLIICGIVLMARAAINRGRMSDPGSNPGDAGRSLEPRHRGVGFLGIGANWPGIALMAAGALMLLLPAFL